MPKIEREGLELTSRRCGFRDISSRKSRPKSWQQLWRGNSASGWSKAAAKRSCSARGSSYWYSLHGLNRLKMQGRQHAGYWCICAALWSWPHAGHPARLALCGTTEKVKQSKSQSLRYVGVSEESDLDNRSHGRHHVFVQRVSNTSHSVRPSTPLILRLLTSLGACMGALWCQLSFTCCCCVR